MVIKNRSGAPGWINQLSLRLQVRSWFHGSWGRALSQALCWQLGAWSVLRILCLCLCLSLSLPSPAHFLSLSLPKINKHQKKFLRGAWVAHSVKRPTQSRLRSWSPGLWVWAPSQALCWQLGAWSLLRIICLPLSPPLSCSWSVSPK